MAHPGPFEATCPGRRGNFFSALPSASPRCWICLAGTPFFILLETFETQSSSIFQNWLRGELRGRSTRKLFTLPFFLDNSSLPRVGHKLSQIVLGLPAKWTPKVLVGDFQIFDLSNPKTMIQNWPSYCLGWVAQPPRQDSRIFMIQTYSNTYNWAVTDDKSLLVDGHIWLPSGNLT